jgi:hypothetical protein
MYDEVQRYEFSRLWLLIMVNEAEVCKWLEG